MLQILNCVRISLLNLFYCTKEMKKLKVSESRKKNAEMSDSFEACDLLAVKDALISASVGAAPLQQTLARGQDASRACCVQGQNARF